MDDKKSLFRKPLFLQVRDALVERIASGEWSSASALPNEIDLARELGVSTGTLRKALDILEAERIVSRRQGRGTFVNDQTSGELAHRFDNTRTAGGEWVSGAFRDVEVSVGLADDKERSRLQLEGAQHVLRIKRVQLFDGSPHMLEQSCVPEVLFPDLQARATAPYQLRIVAAIYGVALARAEERIAALVAERTVAERLEIPTGTAILELDRVVYSSEGTPIEWRLAQCFLRDGHYRADIR